MPQIAKHKQISSHHAALVRQGCSVLGLWLLGSACEAHEPRSQEPPPISASGASLGKTLAAASTAQPMALPQPVPPREVMPRCIRPLPEKPVRAISNGGGVDPRCPNDRGPSSPLAHGTVTFESSPSLKLDVEIARTEEQRARGLMFRRQLGSEAGMLFIFDRPSHHNFWMHNTCLPLDMLFVDADGVIVGIEENATTMDDSTFQVGCASQYVVEVNAGWSRKHQVKPGDKLKFEGL